MTLCRFVTVSVASKCPKSSIPSDMSCCDGEVFEGISCLGVDVEDTLSGKTEGLSSGGLWSGRWLIGVERILGDWGMGGSMCGIGRRGH